MGNLTRDLSHTALTGIVFYFKKAEAIGMKICQIIQIGHKEPY